MQQKQNDKELQSSTIRYKFLIIHCKIINSIDGPHIFLQMILDAITYIQIFKFPIDYMSKSWFGSQTALFSYLDLSYLARLYLSGLYQYLLYVCLTLMFMYILLTLSLFKPFSQYVESLTSKIIKLFLIVFSTILFMPLLGMILSLNSCNVSNFFWNCNKQSKISSTTIILSYIIFSIFALIILVQSIIKFQFIKKPNNIKPLRNSSYSSVVILVYITLNEISFMYSSGMTPALILNVSALLMGVVLWLKTEHKIQSLRRMQNAMVVLNLIAVVLIDLKYFLKLPIIFMLFPLLVPIIMVFFINIDQSNFKFQLDNINKWNTPAIMIRYCSSLREILNQYLNNSYQYIVILHGYIQIHLQKCDTVTCPYRDEQKDLMIKQHNEDKCDEVIKTQQLIKKIYCDGCKATPVNPQLQLQYSIFLYEIGDRDSSLKNLLMIQPQQLSLEKYYKYFSLKSTIFNQLCQLPVKEFLDLISQLQVKRMENELFKKFQQAALVNLQFWSVLNEDHPDFEKLNDIGHSRVELSQQVNQKYAQISRYAHSQRITNIYINYLTSIENDEQMYNEIYANIKKSHTLDKKITLQDWSNSSQPTLLISVEEKTYGNIIDLNSMCASMLGYQKYQILNRHCKVLFQQECRSQMKTFLSHSESEPIYYLLHKNGYLIKTNVNNQNYNSMETGLTIILTFNNSLASNNGLIMMDNAHQKILGCSSSCISLIGLETKILQQFPYLNDIFSIDMANLKTVFQVGNCSYNPNDFLKPNYRQQINQYIHQNQQFTLCWKEINQDLSVIDITLIKYKKSNQQYQSDPIQFQFIVEATLSDFTYIGQFYEGESYLRQFSQISYHHQQFTKQKSIKNYGQKIVTLRLYQNIIRVIEDIQEAQLGQSIANTTNQQQQQFIKIGRKVEEQIFQSKTSYQQFIVNHRITMLVHWVIAIGVILTICMYGTYLSVYSSHIQSTSPQLIQIANQNLLTGALAKTSLLIKSFIMHQRKISNFQLSFLKSTFNYNIQMTQQLRLVGSKPFTVPVYENANLLTDFFSDQFLLSLLNNQLYLSNKLSSCKTSNDVSQVFPSIDPYALFFVSNNTISTRLFMQKMLKQREQAIKSQIKSYMTVEINMMVGGVMFQLILGLILGLIIYRVTIKKVAILKIFLEITQQQILKFSAKTQRFLTSLQMEDAAGEIQAEEQNENKKNSAMFAKKKRFKVIKLQKLIYLKILVIPLLALAFFFHSFSISYNNLNFNLKSIDYVKLAASGQRIFSSGIASIQNQIMGEPGNLKDQVTIQFLAYYRAYFNAHYQTFGKIQSFHQYFTTIFMLDICNGTIKVPVACTIPTLSSNGSLLVFTQATVKLQQIDLMSDFSLGYYQGIQVLSRTHRMLTKKTLEYQAQNVSTTNSNLLSTFIIWMFCLIGVTILYGAPITSNFLNQINSNKNMMTLIPLSVAKQSKQVNKFISQIINRPKCLQ